MRTRRLIAALAALGYCALLGAGPASAQTDLVAQLTLDQLLAILKQTDREGKIVQLSEKSSVIQFPSRPLKDDVTAYPLYCRANGCLLFMIRAHLPKYEKITAELVNEWNGRASIAKTSLNPDGSSEFSYTFSVAGGVTTDHVKTAITLFESEVVEYLGIMAQR